VANNQQREMVQLN